MSSYSDFIQVGTKSSDFFGRTRYDYDRPALFYNDSKDEATYSQIHEALEQIYSTPEGEALIKAAAANSPGGTAYLIHSNKQESSIIRNRGRDGEPYFAIIVGAEENNVRYPSPQENGSFEMHDFSLPRILVHEIAHLALGHASLTNKTPAVRQANEREAVEFTNVFMAKYYGEAPRGDYYHDPHDNGGDPELGYDKTAFIDHSEPISERKSIWSIIFGEDPEPAPGQYIDPVSDFMVKSTTAATEVYEEYADWRPSENMIEVLGAREKRMDILLTDLADDNALEQTCETLDVLVGTSFANLQILKDIERHSLGFQGMPRSKADFLDAIIDEGESVIEDAIAASHCDLSVTEGIQEALTH